MILIFIVYNTNILQNKVIIVSAEPANPALTQKPPQLQREPPTSFPPHYTSNVAMRVTILALVAIGILVATLAVQGKLTNFPQTVQHWFQNINWVQAGIGLGIFSVLVIGAALVIYKAKNTLDPITQTPIGNLTGEKQWEEVVVDGRKYREYGFLDRSTLDANGTGKAFVYIYKDCANHYNVSIVVPAVTPIYAICTMAYNLLRTIIIPFYIIVKLATQGEVKESQRFKLSHIPAEMGKSLWRVVKAPFYATAFILAAIYSWANPMGGRLLGSWIERIWNEDVIRSQGYWSVQGPQARWQFEGGGLPNQLGKNGFFLAGCWQPIAVAEFKEGVCVDGYSLSCFVKEDQTVSSEPVPACHRMNIWFKGSVPPVAPEGAAQTS